MERFDNYLKRVKEHHDRIKNHRQTTKSAMVLMIPSHLVPYTLNHPTYLQLLNENYAKLEVICMYRVTDEYPYIDSCNFESGVDCLIYLETNY